MWHARIYLLVDSEKASHGKGASSTGLSTVGFSWPGCSFKRCLQIRSWKPDCLGSIYYCVMLGKSFPSLSKPSFHHLRNWDIIKVASSGCCRHEIYTWQVKKKCFLKGLAPNRCSITHIHYYYSGNCFLFKLLEKSSHFRDQDAKTILNTEKM